MKIKFSIVSLFLIIATIVVTFSIIYVHTFHTLDRLYFSITAFDLPAIKSFTIGENSDVCYVDVPENYMTVSYNNGAYSYKINNTDSCLYYKINNENPNAHSFTNESTITAFGISKSGKEIIDALKDNEYYMLSEVWAKLDTTWKCSANYQSIERGKIDFNSFIQKKDGIYKIIIIDKYTQINGIGYCYANTLPQGAEFKIQFFKMNNWSVKRQEKRFWDYVKFWDSNTYFSDSIRSYFAKPVQILTGWGAGHIKVTHKDNHFSVTFPKAITTTIPTETIKEKAKTSETGVYLKQMLKSYPMPTDFYIPAFSNALSEYVCEFSANKYNNLIFQKVNARDTVQLATSGSFIPKITVDSQQLVTGGITYKSRILNAPFYWSKHCLLFIEWLVLSILLFFSFPVSDMKKVQDVRYYIISMFTLFWFFLNQKLLIAEKLTFTYPYFEKIYPVSYLTTLFSLCSMFLLIVLINKAYFKVVKNNEKGFKNNDFIRYNISTKMKFLTKMKDKRVVNFNSWFWRIFVVGGIIVFCCSILNQIKTSFILPIWNSYLSSETSNSVSLNFLKWQSSDFLNDNHFTVFMITGSLMVVLLLLFIIPIPKKLLNKLSKILLLEWIFEKTHSWLYFLILILVCLFILRGNFFTAIAVLILLYVLGLLMQKFTDKIPSDKDRYNYCESWKATNNNKFTWSLDWFKYNLLKHKLWRWIIITLIQCCMFVGIGMSDFGFFINIFGIGITWIILIFCCAKHSAIKGNVNNKILNVNFIAGLSVGLLVVGLAVYVFLKANSNPQNIDYGRSTRRIQNCISPNEVKKAGYLYTESDMQWMEVMRYYAEKVKAGRGNDYDIYCEDNNFHQLISSGQSPVILNDVCVPGVYLGSLRAWGWFGLLFGVFALGIFVYWFSIGDTWRKNPQSFTINRQLIGRLLAGNLWIGVTLYLLASYYWQVPFTGRLIPGFGVDAVGETLEIIVLFSFMCALYNPFNREKNDRRRKENSDKQNL